ncbi:MAG: UTP--glucose-1-phosphate uridylyltransferase GalU [Proteobacteria bacterium]|nr:UTP--glucose-1-phosphate uridylyltransferase GalU [Pseudomonadota bacterium]
MRREIKTAVFPVGGMGTRFLPATKAIPKEMLPVVDKPLIQYAVEEAKAAGVENFVFVTGRYKSALEDHFDHAFELERGLEERQKHHQLDLAHSTLLKPGQAAFTRQQMALGLGHAVLCARHLVGDEPFAVILPDDMILDDVLCLVQMVRAYSEVGGNMVAVAEVPGEHTDRYGILDGDPRAGALIPVRGLVEKPRPEEAPSRLALIGRYILQPQVFEHLARQEPGAGGEIQLTDAMAKLIGRQPFHGFRFSGRRFDCGDKAGYLEANIAYALECEAMREPVRAFLKRYR